MNNYYDDQKIPQVDFNFYRTVLFFAIDLSFYTTLKSRIYYIDRLSPYQLRSTAMWSFQADSTYWEFNLLFALDLNR